MTLEIRIWEILRQFLSDYDAKTWLKTPSADFSGYKPDDLIRSGRGEAVLAILENALLGIPS